MPIVPVLDNATAAPTNLPDARQDAPNRMMQMSYIGATGGEKLGAGTQTLGRDMSVMALEQQLHTNELNAKMYDANLISGGDAILHGDPNDPNSVGYLGQKGANAANPDAKQAALDAVDKMAKTSADGVLTNPAQREMVAALTKTRVAELKAKIEAHATQQGFVANAAASEARIGAAADSAAGAYQAGTDTPVVDAHYDPNNTEAPSSYQALASTVAQEATTLAQLHGVATADQPQFVKSIMADKVYVPTLQHLLDGGKNGELKQLDSAQLTIAQHYFDAVKDQLTTKQQDEATRLLTAGALKTTALNTSLDIQGQFPHDIGAQEKELNAQFKTGKVSADEYDIALQHMRASQAQYRGEQGEQDKRLLGSVWDVVTNNPNATVADLSASQLAQIKDRGLGSHVDAIFKRNATTDNPVLFMDIISMSQTNPAGFMAMGSDGIAKLKAQLSTSQFNEVVRTYNGINRQDMQQMASDKLMHDTIRDVSAQLDTAGLNTRPKPGTDAEKNLATFQTNLRDQLVAAQQAKKAPLTQIEAKDIALASVRDQALSGTGYFGYFQDHAPVYQMTPEQRAADWAIPPADRASITASLARANMPATEANIQRVFKLSKGVR